VTTEFTLKKSREMVAIMGGTFDPIHNGHLRAAVELLDDLDVTCLRLMPCFTPVHKPGPSTTNQQRLAMLQRAIEQDNRLCIDTRELDRAGPSYTVDTLVELRQELGQDMALVMVIGMDSFLALPTWHKGLELIT
jgi:nicotinate-nucleotide adenylyltransferase